MEALDNLSRAFLSIGAKGLIAGKNREAISPMSGSHQEGWFITKTCGPGRLVSGTDPEILTASNVPGR
jgi:hypothetical protein